MSTSGSVAEKPALEDCNLARIRYESHKKRLRLPAKKAAKEASKAGVAVWRRFRGRMPAGKCVIFGQGRSGSTLLTTLLESHPALTVRKEILKRRRLLPMQYVAYEASRARTDHFLWHLKPWHLTRRQSVDPVRFVQALERRGYVFVHLRRKNDLLRSLSQLKLITKEIKHVREGDAAPGVVWVDPDMLVSLLREKDREDRVERMLLDAVAQAPVEVEYETDLQDAARHQETCNRIFRALGLEPREVHTELKKASPSVWQDGIANAGEVEAAIREAGYGHWLS